MSSGWPGAGCAGRTATILAARDDTPVPQRREGSRIRGAEPSAVCVLRRRPPGRSRGHPAVPAGFRRAAGPGRRPPDRLGGTRDPAGRLGGGPTGRAGSRTRGRGERRSKRSPTTRRSPPGPGPAASFRLGRDALRRGRWTEAAERLGAPELARSELAADAMHLLAANLPGAKRDEAIARLETLLAEHPDYRKTPAVRLLLGQRLAAAGRREDALPHFAAAAEGGADLRGDALAAQAAALERLGRFEDAVRALETLYYDLPTHAESLNAGRRLTRLYRGPNAASPPPEERYPRAMARAAGVRLGREPPPGPRELPGDRPPLLFGGGHGTGPPPDRDLGVPSGPAQRLPPDARPDHPGGPASGGALLPGRVPPALGAADHAEPDPRGTAGTRDRAPLRGAGPSTVWPAPGWRRTTGRPRFPTSGGWPPATRIPVTRCSRSGTTCGTSTGTGTSSGPRRPSSGPPASTPGTSAPGSSCTFPGGRGNGSTGAARPPSAIARWSSATGTRSTGGGRRTGSRRPRWPSRPWRTRSRSGGCSSTGSASAEPGKPPSWRNSTPPGPRTGPAKRQRPRRAPENRTTRRSGAMEAWLLAREGKNVPSIQANAPGGAVLHLGRRRPAPGRVLAAALPAPLHRRREGAVGAPEPGSVPGGRAHPAGVGLRAADPVPGGRPRSHADHARHRARAGPGSRGCAGGSPGSTTPE